MNIHRHDLITRSTRLNWGLLLVSALFVLGTFGGCTSDAGPGADGTGTVDDGTVDDGAGTIGDPGVDDPTDGQTDNPLDPTDDPVTDPIDDITDPVEDPVEEPVEDPGLTISQVLPNKGLASGGEQVEIAGTGFGFGLAVFFGESEAEDVFILDDKRLVAMTPGRLPGLVDVTVAYPNDEAGFDGQAVLESGFLFYSPVTVVEIDPPSGHVFGGEPITILGTGFLDNSNVLIGGRAAIDIQVVDDTQIIALTPDAPAPGAVNVHVSNAEGIGTLDDGYTYFENPRVSGVIPPVGLVTGGYNVEVRGGGFVDPLIVNFGAATLEDVVILAPDRIMGTVPAGTEPGPIDVVVSTAYGSAVGFDAFTYVEDLTPGDITELIAVTPGTGPANGGNAVTLVAKGLTAQDDTLVLFGSHVANVLGVDAAAHTVIVDVPVGDGAGVVDVTLTNSNGSSVLTGAYVYEDFVKVYDILPTYGPKEGGTDVTISGEGFAAGLQLRIGALPASNVVVVDATTITATTPPGSPGLANVTVLQGNLSNVLVGGFAYQSEMDLWVVDPDQGSQAGGTYFELVGSGFPGDSDVLVGGKAATHVTVHSPTLISARTPPATWTGTVDVTVVSTQKGTVTLPASFTYFDPESQFGGTWGNEVDGEVNITVLSGVDGTGIPDAFVMLWTDPSTPYQGFTNAMGQITFSGPDLEGDQMITASKEGFASTSVVEYNATNVTVYMSPSSPPSPGGAPPGVAPPIFRGQVINASKFVPIPWGQCSQKFAAPGQLCGSCNTDADCGALTCSEVPAQNIEGATYCTQHCATSSDCPTGYMCYPLNGVEEHQCVPSAGQVTAFCDFTKPSIFSRDYLPQPGQQVNEDFSFEMVIPFGEQAIFCWAGILDDFAGTFTPYALGLARHVLGQPNDPPEVSAVVEENVILNHPLNGTFTIRLDDAPRNPTGPDFNYMFLHLDLGSDGTMEFLEHPFSFDADEPLTVLHAPKVLSGDLYDASYTVMAGAFSATDTNLPYTLTLHTGIQGPTDDTFYNLKPDGWTPKATGVTKNINELAAIGEGDGLVGVGPDGFIITSAGESWGLQESGVTSHLKGVDAIPEGKFIAVGEDGTAVHFNGISMDSMPMATTTDFEGVWMVDADEAFAVGWYSIQHWDGVAWSTMGGANTSKNLHDVYGFAADDVWAVGNYGAVIRYNGLEWENVVTGTTQNFRAVWGSAPDDVYIVGEAGTIVHWDGEELTPMDSGKNVTLWDVWGTGPDDVRAVGARGTILRWDGVQWLDESPNDFHASFLTIAGNGGAVTATGTHELLLGPMLQVPENLSPSNGYLMEDGDYVLDWTVKPGVDPHFTYAEVAIPTMTGPIPEWITINDFNVTHVDLPDLPSIEGTPGITAGPKLFTVMRVYKEGFEIDNYSNQDFNQLRWNSWSVNQTSFTKL